MTVRLMPGDIKFISKSPPDKVYVNWERNSLDPRACTSIELALCSQRVGRIAIYELVDVVEASTAIHTHSIMQDDKDQP